MIQNDFFKSFSLKKNKNENLLHYIEKWKYYK
jgi:hypothetical protein